jgi:5-methylcytosine-specific restriction endonuclease McrA
MERVLQELVWQRASNRCEYCQLSQEQDELSFEIDHIIAKKHRGQDQASNLCLACFACNNHKGTNMSGINNRTKKIVPLFNPRRHKWHRHFRWDGPVLLGLTPIGR